MVMVAVNVSMQKGDEKEKGFNTSYGGVDLRSTKQSCDFVHLKSRVLEKKVMIALYFLNLPAVATCSSDQFDFEHNYSRNLLFILIERGKTENTDKTLGVR